MTGARTLEKATRRKGVAKGSHEGFRDVFEEAFNEAFNEAFEEAFREGFEEGLEEIRVSARSALRRIAGRRALKLPTEAEARIDACTDLAMLGQWLENTCVATSGDEVVT